MIALVQALKEKSVIIKKPLTVLLVLLFLDIFVFLFFFSLNNVFRPDILAIAVYFSFYAYLFLTKRQEDIVYLLISSVISVFWILFAGNQYGYNREMIHIFGYSAFPIFSWASGLAILYLVYSDLEQIIITSSRWLNRFFLFSALYLFFIISLETIAYHIFNIRNEATAIYPGLPICDCIHAPIWMQISYFLIGPIYFAVCSYYKFRKNK
jgi:hypothetical protein